MKVMSQWVALLPLVVLSYPVAAAGPNESLAAVDFLVGKWRSTSSQCPAGDRFRYALQGRVLVRDSLHDAGQNEAGGQSSMESMMVIYPDGQPRAFRAIYFDSEGHTIHYKSVEIKDGHRVQFVSDDRAAGPVFRLTYNRGEADTLSAKFEMAMPSQPDSYRVIGQSDEHRQH